MSQDPWADSTPLYAVLAGTSTVAIWLLTSIKIGSNPGIAAAQAISILVLIQGVIALIGAPTFSEPGQRLHFTYGVLGIVLIPWPLFALGLQMTDTSLGLLLLAQVFIVLCMFASYQITRWVQQWQQPSWQPNALTLLQVLPGIGLIFSFPHWQPMVLA